MKVYTKLPCKPHVAAFISKQYERGEDIIIDRGLLVKIIAEHLTPDVSDRLMQLPEKTILRVMLPKRYRNLHTSESKAGELSLALDDFFWLYASRFILMHISTGSMFKEDAIKLFYKKYGITESMYSHQHFRRQLHRIGVKGVSTPYKMERKFSHKLTNQQANQIMHLRQSGVSTYAIADKFNVDRRTVARIEKKVLRHLSQNAPNIVPSKKHSA
jgi:hypothetical protein